MKNHIIRITRNNSEIHLFPYFLLIILLMLSIYTGLMFFHYLSNVTNLNNVFIVNEFVIYIFVLYCFILVSVSKSTDFPIYYYLHLPMSKAISINTFLIFRVINPVNIFFFMSTTTFFIADILTSSIGLMSGSTFAVLLYLLILASLLSAFLSYIQLKAPTIYQNILFSILAIGILYLLVFIQNNFLGLFQLFSIKKRNINFNIILLSLAFALFFYFLAYNLIKNIKRYDKHTFSVKYGGKRRDLSTIGRTKILQWLENKLLWRNTRTRTTLFLYLIYILFWTLWLILGFIGPRFPLLLGSLALSNSAVMYYTIHAFRFRSTIFDRLATFPIDDHKHVEVIERFSQKLILVSGIFVIPLCILVRSDSIIFILSLYIYNVGVLVYLHTFTGSYETARYDPSLSNFSSEHTFVSHPWHNITIFFVGSLPVMLVVLFCENIFRWKSGVFLLLPGMLGLLGHQNWTIFITLKFKKRKYMMLEGFRK